MRHHFVVGIFAISILFLKCVTTAQAAGPRHSAYCQLLLTDGHLPYDTVWNPEAPLLDEFPAGLLPNSRLVSAIVEAHPAQRPLFAATAASEVSRFSSFLNASATSPEALGIKRPQELRDIFLKMTVQALETSPAFLRFHRKWINIREFLPGFRTDFGKDEYEPIPFASNPLALLPREMQRRLLTNLLANPPNVPPALRAAVMEEAAEELRAVNQTEFALDATPRSRMPGESHAPLDRLPIHEEVLFQKFKEKYVGHRPISEQEFTRALNHHVILIPDHPLPE